jgi:hypothetical protein
MKKLFILIFIGTLVSIFSGASSYSNQTAIRHNSLCQTVNSKVIYKQYSYTCTQSKNRLLWKRTKSASISIVGLETTTTKVEIKSFGQKASEDFLAWAKNNKTVKNNHFVYKNHDIAEDVFLSVNRTEIEAKDIFANFVKQDTYSFYGGEDVNWFYTHNKFLPPTRTSNICGIAFDSFAACTNLIDSTFFRVPNAFKDFKPSNTTSVLGAHEYFHFVQMNLLGLTPFTKRSIPRWFEEGTAEFVGHSILSNITSEQYDYVPDKYRRTFISLESDPYVSGRIFVEFIISEYGFESILKMFSESKNDKNFDNVFYTVTKTTLEDTFNKFQKVKNG